LDETAKRDRLQFYRVKPIGSDISDNLVESFIEQYLIFFYVLCIQTFYKNDYFIFHFSNKFNLFWERKGRG